MHSLLQRNRTLFKEVRFADQICVDLDGKCSASSSVNSARTIVRRLPSGNERFAVEIISQQQQQQQQQHNNESGLVSSHSNSKRD
jgi:cob(I)alamin adenosyltransferase